MKDLDMFSEEYLKEVINSPANDLTIALARIALAVKQAKPVAWLLSGGGAKNIVSFDSGNAYVDPLREVTPLYTTPQPAHTEQVIPKGWIAIPATPSQAHLNSIAMRYGHDFYLLNDEQKETYLSIARQMYEECSGQGFFTVAAPKPESE